MNRRGLLGALLAAPFIVRPGLLMPVKPVSRPVRIIITARTVSVPQTFGMGAVPWTDDGLLMFAGMDRAIVEHWTDERMRQAFAYWTADAQQRVQL